jgi:dinuclear metal center YbgI/SA1388 family protein
MKTTANHISDFFQDWAPRQTKLDYDNVGLLIGQPDREIRKVLVCLDVTPEVVAEAASLGADLIAAHHPPIFKKLSSVTTADPTGNLIHQLIRSDIGVVAAHTNLDAAKGGVSFALAGQLELRDCTFLESSARSLQLVRINCPASKENLLAGVIRDAGSVACVLHGAIDAAGSTEADGNETAIIEFAADSFRVPSILAELNKAVPGSAESALRLAVDQPSGSTGFGVIGSLDSPLSTPLFLEKVAAALGSAGIRYSGHAETIGRVAVCGGAGVMLAARARAAGADAFVTADIKYHDFFSGNDGFLLVDAGHYETEIHILEPVAARLRAAFPGLAVSVTRTRTNPVRYFHKQFQTNKNTEQQESKERYA